MVRKVHVRSSRRSWDIWGIFPGGGGGGGVGLRTKPTQIKKVSLRNEISHFVSVDFLSAIDII